MGKTKHDLLKREAAQALNDLDRAGGNVYTLYTAFAPVHPEYAEYLKLIAENLQVSCDMILRFWDHAWGPHPTHFDGYRR